MKVLTFSRQYPTGHPKAGQPTEFVEKVLLNLYAQRLYQRSKICEIMRQLVPDSHPMYYEDTFREYKSELSKGHTIRTGTRFKVGDQVSLRVWSGRPYASKQIEFAQVDVKKVWEFVILEGHLFVAGWNIGPFHTDNKVIAPVASNDGLLIEDFIAWFAIHPKAKEMEFHGQIICWNDQIEYAGKPAELDEEVSA
ncbi:hypothetical protein [Paraflavitalea sp. CAU 1676]|uniref:hypothetical protein n=1 Tax=Paraflavitalea sp. CAU 1676 TaxID=3032598 RepID=UPI0023D9FF79|nr:hypothetical protein [Paraflavitalea sp. CAU 1676]MDF2189304.1 hypothetical protein [Paraflavitalea sp. CAU 1676]